MSVYAAGFPSDPKDGAKHVHNGVTYQWNGNAWDIVETGGGGGGGGGGDCSECIEYVNGQIEDVNELIEEEAKERLAGDEALQEEISAESQNRKDADAEQKAQIDDLEARLNALGELDPDTGAPDLSLYATKEALKTEEEARIEGDDSLQSEVESLHGSFTQLDESVDERLESVPTKEWVFENTADPDKVAEKNHQHAEYARADHTHDDLDISDELEDYAKGKGIVFTKRAGNLYVSWS